jgi:hypothetical protein
MSRPGSEAMRINTSLLAGLAGLSVLMSTAASAADVGTQEKRHPQPPKPIVIELAPEPLMPNSLGLLERDFQRMRATSPNPDKFMGGRWNPRYQTIQPPIQYQPGCRHHHGCSHRQPVRIQPYPYSNGGYGTYPSGIGYGAYPNKPYGSR